MSRRADLPRTRSEFIRADGVLLVLRETPPAPPPAAGQPPLVAGNPAEGPEVLLAVWDDGSVTALNGHVDLGTGIRTALAQIVAEELDLPLACSSSCARHRPRRHQRRLALGWRRRGRRLPHDDEHAVGMEEFAARARQVGAPCHVSAPFAIRIAARCTAATISTCVPQRQRLPESSLRMRASLGFGSRARRAAACITMPLRQ